MERKRTLLKSTIGLGLPVLLLAAACGDDSQTSSTSSAANSSTPGTSAAPGTTDPTSSPVNSNTPGTPAAPDTTGPTSSSSDTAASPPDTAGEAVINPGDGGNYEPNVDPAAFVATIDNPYLPLSVGSRWVYEGRDEEGTERVEVVVTDKRKQVMGITATVVRDTVHIGGELVEDTYDWFAQDRDGNVWYLGETVKNYENGKLADTDGSWEAGDDGALPGIVMPAQPAEGMAYRQEYYEGEAEDMFEIKTVGGSQDVPAGSFDDVITTTDWNPLDPKVIEEKQYAPGVGLIYETKVAGGEGLVELIEFSPPS